MTFTRVPARVGDRSQLDFFAQMHHLECVFITQIKLNLAPEPSQVDGRENCSSTRENFPMNHSLFKYSRTCVYASHSLSFDSCSLSTTGIFLAQSACCVCGKFVNCYKFSSQPFTHTRTRSSYIFSLFTLVLSGRGRIVGTSE